MAHRHFTSSWGRSSTFVCPICQHTTRQTTQDGGTDLCGPCYELSGLTNSLSDDGFENFKGWGERERDAQIRKVKQPERAARIRAHFANLFNAGKAAQ